MTQQDSNLVAFNFNRRKFLKTAGMGLGLAGVTEMASAQIGHKSHNLSDGNVVLFQGDSITDAGRIREKEGAVNEQAGLGNGYTALAAVALLVDRPKAGLRI